MFLNVISIVHRYNILSMAISSSVATPWVFSQDLGCFDGILGSWVFSEGLGRFFRVFKRSWVFSNVTEKYIYLSVFWLKAGLFCDGTMCVWLTKSAPG